MAGRVDDVRPCSLKIFHTWVLAQQVQEGPLRECTAICKDRRRLGFTVLINRTSDITAFISSRKNFWRVYKFEVCCDIRCWLNRVPASRVGPSRKRTKHHILYRQGFATREAVEETVRAKVFVGSDGAASDTRKLLPIRFHGSATDI